MDRCSIELKKDEKKYHLKFVNCMDDIRFEPLHVLCLQLVGTYISKKITRHISYMAINTNKLVE